ncbi:DcuS/MalK family sensor histidine kinase [Saccharibacillus sacchari]|uniref:DcuS/MalK family sensor histidine kinase n=1 Tax=Saccharibacillus sacchari TaxID=456493 RepID=A0ACC6PF87_9BACL
MKIGRYRMRVQTTTTLMVLSVVALALLALYVMISFEISRHTREALEQRAVGIARTVSLTPTIRRALEPGGDSDGVQPYAEAVRGANDIQFVVVLNMQGIRLSHPDPSRIGQHFAGGDETPALNGREFISTASGSLGPSVRAFSPVYGDDGTQVGAVAVGLSLGSVRTAVGQNMWLLYGGMLLGGSLGIFGAVLLARRLKRMMLGMEPDEIARRLEERSAMLQSAKEGILAVDKELRITLINAEARRLIGESDNDGERPGQDARGDDSAESDFRSLLRMDRVLASGEPVYDLEAERGGTALLVNVVPIRIDGRVEGAIATFRDKTEISVLMERLSGISLYADALRAQTHEFMNKLHIIMGLTHMKRYDRLETYLQEAVPSLQIEAGAVTTQIKDPVMAGFLLGKLSLLREAGIRLTVSEEGVLPEAAQPSVSRELVTIVGNLLQNAMEAPRTEAVDKEIGIGFVYKQGRLKIEVSDNGIGIPPDIAAAMYEQGYSTKGDDRGVGLYLVRRSAQRLGGSISCVGAPESGTRFVVELPYEVAKKGVGK